MLEFVAFILWSALLYGITEGAKRICQLIGFDKNSIFVRALPVLPFVFGAITGIGVLPALASDLGLNAIAAMSMWEFTTLGFGAGGFAAGGYKVVSQTILGKDQRLEHGAQTRFVDISKLDEKKFQSYLRSHNGRRPGADY